MVEIDVGDLHAHAVELTATELVVTLADGRKIATPLDWYPRLFAEAPIEAWIPVERCGDLASIRERHHKLGRGELNRVGVKVADINLHHISPVTTSNARVIPNSPAVHLDILPGDEACAGAAEETHRRRDILRHAAPSDQCVNEGVMRRLRAHPQAAE